MKLLPFKSLVALFFQSIAFTVIGQNYPYVTQLSGFQKGMFVAPYDIAIGDSGKIFVNDSDINRIQVLTVSGSTSLEYLTHFTLPVNSPDASAYDLTGFAPLDHNKFIFSDGNNQRIQVFTVSSFLNLELFATFSDLGTVSSEFVHLDDVTVDNLGKIFVLDSYNSRIQVLTIDGTNIGKYSHFGSRGIGNGQFNNPISIAVDNQNRIYVADKGNNRIQVLTIDGLNMGYMSQVGSHGTVPGKFNNLNKIDVDYSGKIYTTEAGNKRIQIFTVDGINLGYYAQYGSNGTVSGQFLNPQGIAVNKQTGQIIVADPDSRRVQSFHQNNDTIAFVSAFGGIANPTYIISPRCISISSNNTLYVTDYESQLLNILTTNGTDLSFQKAVQITTSSYLVNYSPLAIAVNEPANLLYITDTNNGTILTLNISSNLSTSVNSIGSGIGSNPGQLNGVYAMAFDKSRKLYVADGNNHRIQVFTASGTSLGFYASFGSVGTAPGQFYYPYGIVVDTTGKIFVADGLNNRIQVLTMTGSSMGYYTEFGIEGSEDGQFKFPTGVALDGEGKIFVCDYYNQRIQVLTMTGTNMGYYDQFGTFGRGKGEFSSPYSLAIDKKGNIYVSDVVNARIQVFSGASPAINIPNVITETYSSVLFDSPEMVYPNPFIHKLQLKIPCQNLTLTNLQGQIMYKNNNHDPVTEIDINENLPSGIYILTVQGETQHKQFKVVKK